MLNVFIRTFACILQAVAVVPNRKALALANFTDCKSISCQRTRPNLTTKRSVKPSSHCLNMSNINPPRPRLLYRNRTKRKHSLNSAYIVSKFFMVIFRYSSKECRYNDDKKTRNPSTFYACYKVCCGSFERRYCSVYSYACFVACLLLHALFPWFKMFFCLPTAL